MVIGTLRALFNQAIKDGVASESDYPFGLRGFSVNKLARKTPKRYLGGSEMEAIQNTRFDDFVLETARRLFLFLFYAQGMSFTDAANLKESNIEKRGNDEVIVYKRAKTKHSPSANFLEIPVTPNVKQQLEWFRMNKLLVEDYLLPIVSVENKKKEELYGHIRYRYQRINEFFKELGREA